MNRDASRDCWLEQADVMGFGTEWVLSVLSVPQIEVDARIEWFWAEALLRCANDEWARIGPDELYRPVRPEQTGINCALLVSLVMQSLRFNNMD